MIEQKLNIINIDFSLIPYTKDTHIDCLIIMNSEINDQLLTFFIGITENILLCDGGSNSFYQSVHRQSKKVKAIVGDLDSIKLEVRQYYHDRNVVIQDLSQDQDTNDLQKCIKYALKQKYQKIACIGALGGRFDQEMCNINIIERYGKSQSQANFIVIGKKSIIIPIKSNFYYRVIVGENFHKQQCGLICFGSSKVETTGFKWNLGKQYGIQQLKWNNFVSSSNHRIEDAVSIHSSESIIFSIQYDPIHKEQK